MIGLLAMPKGLTEWARLGAAFVLGCLVTAPLAYCEGRSAAKGQYEAARAEANVEALKTNADASERAAEERAADATEVAEQEEDLIDAIQSTPDTAPDTVRVRLGCERLRAQGTDTAAFPACR